MKNDSALKNHQLSINNDIITSYQYPYFNKTSFLDCTLSNKRQSIIFKRSLLLAASLSFKFVQNQF